MKPFLAIAVLIFAPNVHALEIKAIRCLIYENQATTVLIYANSRGVLKFQNGETANVSVSEQQDKLVIKTDLSHIFDRYIDRDSGEIFRKHWISLKDNSFKWKAIGTCEEIDNQS